MHLLHMLLPLTHNLALAGSWLGGVPTCCHASPPFSATGMHTECRYLTGHLCPVGFANTVSGLLMETSP